MFKKLLGATLFAIILSLPVLGIAAVKESKFTSFSVSSSGICSGSNAHCYHVFRGR
ncbi:MAG: hypothetical protein ABJN26_03910 [Stappiaceae bacterium]